jgi:16S rRNA G966 N2-methylase RsmD
MAENTDYPTYRRNVGGKEPGGKPTKIGKWTFGTKMVREVVVSNMHGDVLNACAGKTNLGDYKRGVDIHRNDINEDIPSDTHHDVLTIDEHFPRESFDTVIFDPPFNARLSEKLYEGMHNKDYWACREALSGLVRRGGTYIELGYDSWGVEGMEGWERIEDYHYRDPSDPDVWLVVDRKINQRTLSE